ncbi:hypothetical protein ACFLSJ_01820 [Verrucomicrobiota bacterium]
MNARMMVAWVVVAAVAATGCGKKKQERDDAAASRIASKAISVASGKDVKVKVDGDTVTYTDAEGGVTMHAGKGAKLPQGFPDDLPVYEKAEILHAASMGEDEFSVSLQSKDAVAAVAGFYKESMESEGWEPETVMDMQNRAMLAYRKGNRAANVMIAADQDGGSVISLTTGVMD